MKIKALGLCRGDGKLYVKIKTSKPVSTQNFAAKLWGEGRLFPINCYPAGLLPERDLGDSERGVIFRFALRRIISTV